MPSPSLGTIDDAFVQSFKDGVRFTAQQKGSKLRPYVMTEDQASELQGYDQVKKTYMVSKQQFDLTPPNTVQGRHGISPIIATAHRKRNVQLGNWILGDAIDDQDKVLTLNDFENAYVKNFGYASGRQMDYCLINGNLSELDGSAGVGGIFGTNRLGITGDLSLTWDQWIAGTGAAGTDGDVAHPAHRIAHGGVGMTLEKWIQAKTTLDGADLVEDEGGRCIVMTELQLQELLSDPQLTSSDYSTVKALVAGEINTYLGMEVLIISSNARARADTSILDADNVVDLTNVKPLIPHVLGGTNYHRCFAFCKNYLLLTLGIDDEANIAKRADLNFTWYAHLASTFGSTRMEEAAFVEIQTATA